MERRLVAILAADVVGYDPPLPKFSSQRWVIAATKAAGSTVMVDLSCVLICVADGGVVGVSGVQTRGTASGRCCPNGSYQCGVEDWVWMPGAT